MKGFDFTQTGGFPLTQDVLGYLQEGYTEAVRSLAAIGGNTAGPMVISGMEVTEPSPGEVAVTNGWFMYNGDLIQFIGGTVTPAIPDVAVVSISVSATSLAFFDGDDHYVKQEKLAALMTGDLTLDATRFPVASLRPFGRELSWGHIPVVEATIGNVDGDIYYKKNYLTNSVMLKGFLEADFASYFASPGIDTYYEMGTVPEGYRPTNSRWFDCSVITLNVTPFTLWEPIKSLRGRLDPDGKIYIEWMQYLGYGGAMDFGTYSCQFAVSLFLD